MSTKKQNFCPACHLPKITHWQNWVDASVTLFFPKFLTFLSRRLDRHFASTLPKLFIALRLAHFETLTDEIKLEPRTKLFTDVARQNSATVEILKTRFGHTDHFRITLNDQAVYFDTLPIAEFANQRIASDVDDKKICTRILREGNFPVLPSHPFWFWQRKKALRFARKIDFPVVVKPRAGSVARHVTTNIKNEIELELAIDHANEFSPYFLVEKYQADCFVHRATLIDGLFVACAKQLPAHVVGNGQDSIARLIEQKNTDPRRDDKFYHKLTADESFLRDQALTTASVPANDQTIFLQKDPFMRYGGDIAEVTDEVHPDNVKLFSDIASHFGLKIIGLDFMIKDIARSWREQPCAVLEVNTVPCIEMHHYPIYGTPRDVAGKIFEMFKKYYLK